MDLGMPCTLASKQARRGQRVAGRSYRVEELSLSPLSLTIPRNQFNLSADGALNLLRERGSFDNASPIGVELR